MIQNFKISIIIVLVLFCSCKKQEDKDIGRELITQNINILIDSIESFDTSKMPEPNVSLKDFKNYKPIKIEQISVGLLDSILIDNDENPQITNQEKFLKFNLQKSDLVNFKSEYKINIVKVNNYDTNILFVRFSNFQMNKNEANIEVKMNIGISMIKNRYYFKKENDVWVFKKKKLLGMG
jgi:hypothetical protein